MNLNKSLRIKLNKIHETIIVILMFFPSLYYSLANLLGGYTILYFICFACGAISYILLVRRPNVFFSILCLISIIFLYSTIMNSKLLDYIFSFSSIIDFSKSKLVLLIFLYLPAFVVCLSKKLDFEYILSKMFLCSIIILPLDIVIGTQRMIHYSYLVDYMTIAYQISFWLMFCLFGALLNQTVWPLLLVIPSTILVIFGGSRGALLYTLFILFSIFCMKTLFNNQSKGRVKRLLLSYVLFIVIILMAINFTEILNIAVNVLDNLGYSSRTLNSILSSSFLENFDRMTIQAQLYPHLFENIFGSGIYSDRFLQASGQYAHNFFLELLIDFGLVSVIVILIIFRNTINAMFISFRPGNKHKQYIFIFCLVTIFVKFMFSASYLESTECFLALGLLYNIVTFREKRNKIYAK